MHRFGALARGSGTRQRRDYTAAARPWGGRGAPAQQGPYKPERTRVMRSYLHIQVLLKRSLLGAVAEAARRVEHQHLLPPAGGRGARARGSAFGAAAHKTGFGRHGIFGCSAQQCGPLAASVPPRGRDAIGTRCARRGPAAAPQRRSARSAQFTARFTGRPSTRLTSCQFICARVSDDTSGSDTSRSDTGRSVGRTSSLEALPLLPAPPPFVSLPPMASGEPQLWAALPNGPATGVGGCVRPSRATCVGRPPAARIVLRRLGLLLGPNRLASE